LKEFKRAYNFVEQLSAEGGSVLFVGTKKQSQSIIIEQAQRCQSPYVANRWLGGMLTNFITIKKSIDKLDSLNKSKEQDLNFGATKKEAGKLEKIRFKLDQNLAGIMNMKDLPDAIFIVDIKKDYIALKEGNGLKIPVIGIVDTNCDPDFVDYVIPGNDDAIRAIQLITSKIADAILEGKARYETMLKSKEDEKDAANKKALDDKEKEKQLEFKPKKEKIAVKESTKPGLKDTDVVDKYEQYDNERE
jgi:small subunit ribosomal protein S2